MKQNEKLPLPIDPFIPQIIKSLTDYSTLIVKASPGSGKTTRLPWAIAKAMGKNVVVLEPRRLAAKLAAIRIADEEKLVLGKDVGFHFRFEKNCTEETKLIFYTEGTFLKKFLQNPDLEEVDIVILDEFHERHLETDLALALIREVQKKRNLKILLMSATLDLTLMDAFPGAKSIEIEAPMYPVEISYLPNQPSILNQSLETKVRKALDTFPDGDTLIFLPGMREMMKVQSALSDKHVLLLHADLSKEEQNEALLPSPQRKIILSTNIAESSVTIPGIKIVIDSGIQREAHFSPWNGLKFIEDAPVTKSSAIQRAGRAGRTGPGQCLRLYSQQDFNQRPDHTIPEIERADLTDIYLLVMGTNIKPAWFHSPPKEKWDKARQLLEKLGAIKEEVITPMGKQMLEFPLDSRLARILIAGENLNLRAKEQLLKYICENIEEDRTGTLKRRLSFYLKTYGDDQSPWEKYILLGFIDQVAKLRKKQRDFIHYSGKIIKIHSSQTELHDDYYIILDITQRQEAIKLLPIDEVWVWEVDPFPLTEEDEIISDEKISLRRKTKLGSIVVEESSIKLNWDELSSELKNKLEILTTNSMKQTIKRWKESPQFERLLFWAKIQLFDLESLLDTIKPCEYFAFEKNLTWENLEYFLLDKIGMHLDLKNIDRDLPTKIDLGGKRELVVHYPVGMDPYLEAPIQDFYGLIDGPTLLHGKIPLTLKLIGPHKRPMQITKDLKNFWSKTYQEMKKEYQREYPRHYWPEKPWEAKPILLKRQLPPEGK